MFEVERFNVIPLFFLLILIPVPVIDAGQQNVNSSARQLVKFTYNLTQPIPVVFVRWLGEETDFCWLTASTPTSSPELWWTYSERCTWSGWLPAIPAITRVTRTAIGFKKSWWSFANRRYSRRNHTPGIYIIYTTFSRCISWFSALGSITLFLIAVRFWKSPTATSWNPKSPPLIWAKKYESAESFVLFLCVHVYIIF